MAHTFSWNFLSFFSVKAGYVCLLSLIAGNITLLALDIPVVLPSDQTIHLNVKYVGVDPDSCTVYIESTIKDPEETGLFFDVADTLEIMSQSMKERWKFKDLDLTLIDPNAFTLPVLTLTSSNLEPVLEKPIFPSLPFINTQSSNDRFGGSMSTGGTVIMSSSHLALSTPLLCGSTTVYSGTIRAASEESTFTSIGTLTFGPQDQTQQIKEETLIASSGTTMMSSNHLALSTPLLCGSTTVSGTFRAASEESTFTPAGTLTFATQDQTQQIKEEVLITSPKPADAKDPTFIIQFSIPGNKFGGGWRLAPYELIFIPKQARFEDKGYSSDGIETMAILIAPAGSGLYQKWHAYPDFFPAQETLNVLTAHPGGTFTLRTSLKSVFFFNGDGQLIRSLQEEGPCSTYDYSDGKLTRICHADSLGLSFEYEGEKVINIKGLPNRIHLEYDDRDLLCKISDEQGSFLQLSYDEDSYLEKIVDNSGAILFGSQKNKKGSDEVHDMDAIPLLFNYDGEVFYYKDRENNLKISYRSWDLEDAAH